MKNFKIAGLAIGIGIAVVLLSVLTIAAGPFDGADLDKARAILGLTLDTTATLGTSDTKVPSQKAVKTYVDTVIPNASISTDTALGTSDTVVPSQKAAKVYADTKSLLAGSSSIVTVGTVGTGSWHATTIALDHGGTGATTAQGVRTALDIGTILRGPAVARPATAMYMVGDFYIATDSGTEAAYICVKQGVDSTGWALITAP
jgi:hypothetical protein